MDCIASALHPIPAVVWGEKAMTALGVRLVCEDYMLVIEDVLFDNAIHQLRLSGFRDCDWSYGSVHPDFYNDTLKQSIYRSIVQEYSNLDRNSARFLFPDEHENTAKAVLLPSSYAHLHPSSISEVNVFRRHDNIIYPSGPILLQSFVQTLVREPIPGMWKNTLGMWSVSNAYGELMLSDDVLDTCDDDEAKSWFNHNTNRCGVGIDRVTYTKRLGRVGYDDSLARFC